MRFPGVYAATGVFVCLEGGDGSGKSTQSQLLGDALVAEGYAVRLTFEPGDTAVGKEMRRIVLSPATGELDDRTEALLYAADKAEHIDRWSRPALERGEVVITDRYVDSLLAYQGAGRDLARPSWSTSRAGRPADLRPHLTVLLDLEPEAGLTVRGARPDREESLEFHQRVRQVFLDSPPPTPSTTWSSTPGPVSTTSPPRSAPARVGAAARPGADA